MDIRSEAPNDWQAITSVTTAAFLGAEHCGGNEAEIIVALREAGHLAISLVATEDDGNIVGHIGFSAVLIDGRQAGWFGLAPISVSPDWRGQGIGKMLVEAGLAILAAQGAAGCVVLGDPAYYSRFGFVADSGSGFWLDGVPPEYFQVLPFGELSCNGKVEFHPAFGPG